MRAAQALCLLVISVAAGCARPASTVDPAKTTLRIAISAGRMSVAAPDASAGLAQVRQNLSVESLASFGDDGSPRPSVAESWTVSSDDRTVEVRLRPNLKYQDGTPVSASDVATLLRQALPRSMGPAFEDIQGIEASGEREIQIRFGRPSGFRLELLEIPVLKPGTGMGTGPYAPVPGNSNELRANDNYYLGKPTIRRIEIESYPTFRSAWADLLRGNNDMLYEVGVDALDSLQKARNVAHVFTFRKRYQFIVLLNTKSPELQSPAIRQALNLAIDRQGLIREALDGYGEPSVGPVSPNQWAISGVVVPKFRYDPQRAAALVASAKKPIRFTCLVLADHERLALVVKQQLDAVGVDMKLQPVTGDELLKRVAAHDFDAVLTDAVSGPTMYRLYRFWHTGNMFTAGGIGGPALDDALDQIRHAGSDVEYRDGVLAFLRATIADPPGIFLAWSEGARAISSRFEVPADPSRPDPIGTLRLWKPVNVAAPASRN